jgi:hypothetical protein
MLLRFEACPLMTRLTEWAFTQVLHWARPHCTCGGGGSKKKKKKKKKKKPVAEKKKKKIETLAYASTPDFFQRIVNETAFRSWLNDLVLAPHNGQAIPPNTLLPTAVQRRAGMSRDFLTMMSIAGVQPPMPAPPGGSNTFYVPGSPACFGLYMFLQMCPLLGASDLSGMEIFRLGFSATKLDQRYGGTITGLLCAAAASAPAAGRMSASSAGDRARAFPTWFLNATDALLRDILRGYESSSAEFEYASMISARLEAVRGIARNVAVTNPHNDPWNADNFLNAWRAVYGNATLAPQHALKNSDPLAQTMLIVMALEYVASTGATAHSGNGFDTILGPIALVGRAAGDSDTTASFLGIILGAFTGASGATATNFDDVKAYLTKYMGLDIADTAAQLAALASNSGP